MHKRNQKRWRVASVVAAGLGLVAAGAVAGCAGMKKSEVEARLLALPKNEGLAALGLQRRKAKVVLEGREVELEYVWVHSPAKAGATAGPIVFVHGTPASLFNWSLLWFDGREASKLVGEVDLYAFDVVGHGVMRTSAPPYTFQSCADSVRGFLELLDLHDVTLVGQSYGGEFAWRAALDAPERVSKLVLMDSSGYARKDGEWLPEEEKLRNWPGAQFGYLLSSRERIRPALQLHFSSPIRDDQLDEMSVLCENADNWKAMTQLCRDENGTREKEIASVRQPTLLLWGERDIAYTVEKVAKRFAHDIAGSLLVLAPGVGHYPQEEAAPFVRDQLLAFHLGASDSKAVAAPSADAGADSGAASTGEPAAMALSVAASDTSNSSAPRLSARAATWSELQAVFPEAWRFPDEIWAPTNEAERATRLPFFFDALLERRFDAAQAAPAWTRSFGDVVAEAKRRGLERSKVDALLGELKTANAEAFDACGEPLRQMLPVDGARAKKWDGGRDLDDDGLYFGAVIDRNKASSEPWSKHKGAQTLHQAATLMFADLEAIKGATNDYPSMLADPGTAYERIGPTPDTFVAGADEEHGPFAALRIRFRSDLPFPFTHYDCDLGILDTLDAKGRLTTDVFTPSRDFYWFGGRDVLHPVRSSDGTWQATLLVRIAGFDLKSVPDGDSDRMAGTRVALGNLRRRAEEAFASYGGPPRTTDGAMPSFEVRGAPAGSK